MKVKTSITLSRQLLNDINHRCGRGSRSEFIEKALVAYLAQLAREERDAADLEIINAHAAKLNEEATDVLSYQVDI